jgi:hypothetical protein
VVSLSDPVVSYLWKGRGDSMPKSIRAVTRLSPQLLRFMRSGSRDFRRAETIVVNNRAFGFLSHMRGTLEGTMTVRQRTFLRAATRVQKAVVGAHPIALVGSVDKERFSGWREQQFGTKTKRRRLATRAARAGNVNRKVTRRARLMPGKQVWDSMEVAHGRDRAAVVEMLHVLWRRNDPNPFFILRGQLPNFKRGGIFKFGRGSRRKGPPKLQRLWSFDRKKLQPKKTNWMQIAIATFRLNPQKEWEFAIDRVFGPSFGRRA